MALNKGEMAITIQEDGRLKIETGDMGGVSHKSADDLIKMLEQIMGGSVETEKIEKGHHHHHHHGDDHHHHHGDDHHHH